MKKRNLVIVAFMLVAAMTIGVGYAALSANLTISGTAKLDIAEAEDQITEDVFISAGTVESTGTNTGVDGGVITDFAHVESESSRLHDFTGKKYTNVVFEVNTLAQIGQTATFTYTISNTSDNDAVAEITFDENTSKSGNYFVADISWPNQADDSVVVSGNKVSIPSGKTATVNVVVELNHFPATAEETHVSDTFEFTLAATLVTQ